MKKFFVLTLTLLAGAMNMFAQDCATIQEGYTGNALIRFVRYKHNILPGRFAVSASDTVRFAQGNLQYRASTDKWRFAENQWDVVGNAAGNTTEEASRASQDNWIDLFGWGCSGKDNGQAAFMPYYCSETESDYRSGTKGTSIPKTDMDWAYYNTIINGGNAGGPESGQWYVLTREEWCYVLGIKFLPTGASDSTSIRDRARELCGYGQVHGVNGLIILPDGWNWDDLAADTATLHFKWTPYNKLFTDNVIRNEDDGNEFWRKMENYGAVFLPVGGVRQGTTVKNTSYGYYHTMSYNTSSGAKVFSVRLNNQLVNISSMNKSDGRSIRPVQKYE